MRARLFSAKRYDHDSFEAANVDHRHTLDFLDVRLDEHTASLAAGVDAVCVFVNDRLDAATVERLAGDGVTTIALRCAGYNNVDVEAADAQGLTVVRVPSYAPAAVAEHTLALMLSLDRQIHRAYHRVRDQNFSLEGLLGRGLNGRTAGVVGTGQIGRRVALLLLAFGCPVVASDLRPDDDLVAAGVRYVGLDELLGTADIIALTCPLTADTYHLVDAPAIELMKPGVMLVNTGRGALVSATAVIDGLMSGRIGSVALDVYEAEVPLFFEDRSDELPADDVFARLLSFPNVLVTAHQGFFTAPALDAIARTTLGNLDDVEAGRPCPNAVRAI